MITNAVGELMIVRNLKEAVKTLQQVVLHLQKGEPDSYTKSQMLYVKSCLAEVEKIERPPDDKRTPKPTSNSQTSNGRK
jgi:hypothetical protein